MENYNLSIEISNNEKTLKLISFEIKTETVEQALIYVKAVKTLNNKCNPEELENLLKIVKEHPDLIPEVRNIVSEFGDNFSTSKLMLKLPSIISRIVKIFNKK